MTREEIAANAARVIGNCGAAAVRSGRSPDSVTVVAVTKTHPLDVALAALPGGIRDFGENRVQEAEAKWEECEGQGARLHMVGRLQRNKARKAVELFDAIHSCDSIALAERLSRVAGPAAVRVFLEVNIGGEATKAGFSPDELRRSLQELAALPNLELAGLMTVAPVVDSPEDARPWFISLRRLGEELRAQKPELGPGLSMGMTGDYEVAIEEGATLVRVGRAIYGARGLLR